MRNKSKIKVKSSKLYIIKLNIYQIIFCLHQAEETLFYLFFISYVYSYYIIIIAIITYSVEYRSNDPLKTGTLFLFSEWHPIWWGKSGGEPRPNIVYTYFHFPFHFQVEDNDEGVLSNECQNKSKEVCTPNSNRGSPLRASKWDLETATMAVLSVSMFLWP